MDENLTGEGAVLANDVASHPNDGSYRMILADWVEENLGDAGSAAILREADTDDLFVVEIGMEYQQGPHDQHDHDWEHMDPTYEGESEEPCDWAEAVDVMRSEGRGMRSETGYPVMIGNAADVWYASESDQDFRTAMLSRQMMRVRLNRPDNSITHLVAWLMYRSAGLPVQ